MRNPHVLKHYNTQTYPAKDFGCDDEKRLNRHFCDRFLRLRWHPQTQKFVVWYDSPKDLYSIFAIDPPYDINKAIHNLEQRQRNAKQLTAEFLQNFEAQQRHEKKEIAEIATPIADAIKDRIRGKVSVLV